MALLGLPNKVLEFLQQNREQKFTAREIADWIFETYPDDCHEKQERSAVIDNETALLKGIRSEITSYIPRLQKRHPEIKTIESYPLKYYLTESTDSAEIDQAEISEASPASKKKEHDLYPILSEFLWSELGIYSKRIDEKQSKNSRGPGGNKYRYPDLVGMEDLSGDWDDEVKQCVKEYGDEKRRTKLWSFEVKRTINGSNMREAFFQAFSNSSWANFGYLVASDIEGQRTPKELDMLASSYGIGFIHLNAEKPLESQILIPAKERSEINWDAANGLIVNTDFRKYIKLIRNFYLTGELRPADWDMSTDGN